MACLRFFSKSICVAAAGLILSGAPAAGQNATTSPAVSAQEPLWPAATTYTNPLNVPVADPFVLQEGDTYYMYGTTENGGAGYQVFTSPDLVRWTRAAKAYQPTKDSWGKQNFWAPEVIKVDGLFYLHYTSLNPRENRRNICVAVAESPLGPFKDYAGPLYPDRSIIDSHIYRDDESGKLYIYASPEHEPLSKILGAELSQDLKQIITTPTVCLTSEYGWEDLWIEGPIIHKHNNTLYMIYSGGAYWEADYALGYATATSPLGPWTKAPGNPLLKKSRQVEGPGHNGLAWSPDGRELFNIYHAHVSKYSIRRVAALDRLQFDKTTSGPDILSAPSSPSHEPQPLPSGAGPLLQAASDDFSGDALDLNRWEIFSNSPQHWTFADGKLTIGAGNSDLWRMQDEGENLFLQRIPPDAVDFALETRVEMDATRINEQAFLVLWRDQDYYVTFAAARQNKLRFVTTVEQFGKANAVVAPNELGWPFSLRIEKRGTMIETFASSDGKNWIPACRPVDIGDMQFTHVGLGAWSPGTDRRTPASFDYFRIERLPEKPR